MARIHWLDTTLFDRVNELASDIRLELAVELEAFAEIVERYMKSHASWEDRTGDARANLTAEAYVDLLTSGIILSHGVDYGIWLEVRWGGKYAIIIPTQEIIGPVMMASLEGLLDRADDGLL